MHPIFSKTVWIILFLIALTLPASSLIEADFVADLRDDRSHHDRISNHKLEMLFSRRLHPFSRSKISAFSKHFLKLCSYHRFDPVFILSVIDVESRFLVKARSEVGALGLMQMMPDTAQFVADELDFHLSGLEKLPREEIEERLQIKDEKTLSDPFINTALGISYLAWLRDHYQGSPFRMLAAYFVGPARMDELLTRKSFKPVQTQEYFNAVRQRVPRFSKVLRRARMPMECLVDLQKEGCYLEL